MMNCLAAQRPLPLPHGSMMLNGISKVCFASQGIAFGSHNKSTLAHESILANRDVTSCAMIRSGARILIYFASRH